MSRQEIKGQQGSRKGLTNSTKLEQLDIKMIMQYNTWPVKWWKDAKVGQKAGKMKKQKVGRTTEWLDW